MTAGQTVQHAPVGGRTIRVTRINTYGQVVTGACAMATSRGWTQVQITDNLTTRTTYDIRTGGPLSCLPVRSKPALNWCDVVADFARVEPDVYTLCTGETLLYDASGASVGFAGDTDAYATGAFALELWTGIAGRCTVTGLPTYGYLLLPWVCNAVRNAQTHGIGTVSFRITALTTAGTQWGAGPYNVVANTSGTPVPLLTPVPTKRHRMWQLTTVPPPLAVAGCQTL